MAAAPAISGQEPLPRSTVRTRRKPAWTRGCCKTADRTRSSPAALTLLGPTLRRVLTLLVQAPRWAILSRLYWREWVRVRSRLTLGCLYPIITTVFLFRTIGG